MALGRVASVQIQSSFNDSLILRNQRFIGTSILVAGLTATLNMSTTYLVVQIILATSIASAVINTSQLYKMVDYVVDSYINDSCLVVISSGGYTAANYVPAVYVAPYNQETQDQNVSLIAEDSYKMGTIAPVLELGCTGYLVQAENPGRQLQLIEKTFVHVNQRTQRRFIFLPTITRDTRKSIGVQDKVLDSDNFDFRSVLQEKSIQYIPDVIFAVPNDQANHVAIFTHRFTGPEKVCRQEMLLDTYDFARERFELGTNLFPDKVKNLEGKVLTVAVFHYPPYSVMINNDDEKFQFDGTEWRFAAEFAKLHNASLDECVDNEEWGHINENLTGEGVTGNIVEDKADLGISALYSWHYESLFLDLTAPFYRSGITCLVPEPRQIPEWMSPILPFAPTLWLIYMIMLIVSAIFTGIVNRAESIVRLEDSFRMSVSEAAITVAEIMLLQGLTKTSRGPAWAALSITLLITALLITTAYGSSLASAMTVPRYEIPIDTALELAASGIPWAATNIAWIFSLLSAEEPELRTLVKNFKALSRKELIQNLAEDDNWAYSIERLQGGHYSIQDYLNRESVEKMHLMKTDIYWEYCVSMLRKSSPFTRWYSRRILEIQASGIPVYWEADVTLRYLDAPTQLAVAKENVAGGGPVRMTASQVQGTFFILAIGLILSGLVFLGELFTRLQVADITKRRLCGTIT